MNVVQLGMMKMKEMKTLYRNTMFAHVLGMVKEVKVLVGTEKEVLLKKLELEEKGFKTRVC